MKIREGFVSNSSSSSFLAKAKDVKDSDERYTGYIKVDFRDFGTEIKSKMDLDGYFRGHYLSPYSYYVNSCKCKTLEDLFKEDDTLEEQYNRYMDYVDAGVFFVLGEIGNDCDSELQAFLYDNGLERSVMDGPEIIES